ncbi:Hsp20/alpha crystallin family protein [Halorientalis brevis]|uniref:Hsp20/alpha crystallin family protein n=1 Tax=Halorientalis brevis TaxID=1126241 RepID=A0ABD6CG14_9EURY|nr:Hsp20/alpha crystallin family protein [Halorientalis brevis]
MTRRPRDRDERPFDDVFTAFERLVEEMVENTDRMMGPYGHVNIDVDHQFDHAEHGRQRRPSEAHVDVQEANEAVQVVADLPGVSKDGIEVTCDGRTLTISATGERREYAEQVRLPARVDEQSATATYNNGVLEITLSRADSDDGGTPIDVE